MPVSDDKTLKTFDVFPFKIGDKVAHRNNKNYQAEEIIDIVPCKPPFGLDKGKCNYCIPKLLMKVKSSGYQGTGCWCAWNASEVCWKVKSLKTLPKKASKVNITSQGHTQIKKTTWDDIPWKKPVGLIKDLVLDDGDVLLVRIPTDWKLEKSQSLMGYLDAIFGKQGFYKRNIAWAVVTDDIGFSVLKVAKGISKEEAVKGAVQGKFRLIRLGEDE